MFMYVLGQRSVCTIEYSLPPASLFWILLYIFKDFNYRTENLIMRRIKSDLNIDEKQDELMQLTYEFLDDASE